MATGFDKKFFANPGFAAAFMCIRCKLICTDIRELSCIKGHLCCASCWAKIKSKQCPNCGKNQNPNKIDIKRSRFVEAQQSKLKLKCPNHCKWNGIFGLLPDHLRKHCVFRKETCQHCNKSFIYKQFTIHRETCNYLQVSCPLSCDRDKKWLRMEISQHLKRDCPNYVVKCEHIEKGCKQKSQRHKMKNHLKFECEYRMVECPFIQYGCKERAQIPYHKLKAHLKDFEVKHMSYKLVHVCDEMRTMQHTMNETFTEQAKQIEFLQRKLQFHGTIRTEISNDNVYDLESATIQLQMKSLSNDCNGLLVFCGSEKGVDSKQNCVEFINIKNKSKYQLFSETCIDSINRIYNHQYRHLHVSRNKRRKSLELLSRNSIEFKDLNLEEKQAPKAKAVRKEQENALQNASANDNNSWDVLNMAMCTGYNIKLSYIQPYLLNSSFGNNTSGIESVFNFNNMDFWKREKITMVFRCGGSLSKTGAKLSRVDGCCLETNDWFQLPYMNTIRYGSAIIYSHIYGLIVVGGNNDRDEALNTVQRLLPRDTKSDCKFATLKWESLPNMFTERYSAAVCLWHDLKVSNSKEAELLIVSGGYNKRKGDLKSCSIYDFNCEEWNEISDMEIGRSGSTLIHWKYRDKCVNVGGQSDIASTSVEEYDLIKDQWYKLPDLKETHRYHPNVWIDNSVLYGSYNGVLCVCGGNYGHNKLGSIEILDVRDSANKWQSVAQLSSFFQSDDYKRKVIRRILCC